MKALSDVKLNYLIQKIKGWVNDTFCLKTHTHNVGTDSTGILKPENGGTGVTSISALKEALGTNDNSDNGGTMTTIGSYLGTGDDVCYIILDKTFYPEMIIITKDDFVGSDSLTLILPESENTVVKMVGATDDIFIEYYWQRCDSYYDWENETEVTGIFNNIVIASSDNRVAKFNEGQAQYRYIVIGRNTEANQNFTYVP